MTTMIRSKGIRRMLPRMTAVHDGQVLTGPVKDPQPGHDTKGFPPLGMYLAHVQVPVIYCW
jgi:hypothetical protein